MISEKSLRRSSNITSRARRVSGARRMKATTYIRSRNLSCNYGGNCISFAFHSNVCECACRHARIHWCSVWARARRCLFLYSFCHLANLIRFFHSFARARALFECRFSFGWNEFRVCVLTTTPPQIAMREHTTGAERMRMNDNRDRLFVASFSFVHALRFTSILCYSFRLSFGSAKRGMKKQTILLWLPKSQRNFSVHCADTWSACHQTAGSSNFGTV